MNETGKGFSEISPGSILPFGLTLKTPRLTTLGTSPC
jgi:hypothetical protein